MDSTPPTPSETHSYISTACLHNLHTRCRDTCKFCAAPCECPVGNCGHSVDAFSAEQQLLQRLSLAIHNTPGFINGVATAWLIAHSVLKELKTPDPLEELR